MLYIPNVFIFKGEDCGELLAPQHGSKTGEGYLYADKIKFACDAEYNS